MNKKMSYWHFSYEMALAALALISILFIWNDDPVYLLMDRIIWGIFVIDVVVRLSMSKKKWSFIKANPLDFIAVIPLDDIFLLSRLARLIKLVRAILILRRYTLPIQEILHTNQLGRVIVVLIIVIFLSSIPIQWIEPEINSYQDAIWWAIVTATTVGYGDISPETPLGRIIAVFLMLFGIGLIGLVTSSVAAYFMTHRTKKEHPTITFMKAQITNIEHLTDQELNQLHALIDTYRQSKPNQSTAERPLNRHPEDVN